MKRKFPPANTRRILPILAAGLALGACTDSSATDAVVIDAGVEGDASVEPDAGASTTVELTTDLCDDPADMVRVLESPTFAAWLSEGRFNAAQVQRMIDAPTDGPFYMFNLIRYREQAEYPDGRPSDLTGREANALYSPTEFIAAIGARVVFNTEVNDQIDGDDTIWEGVAIVEYPCPTAFFAMLANPDFQERSIHKEAGVEETIVLVTNLSPALPPSDPDQSNAQFPPTADDPAFDLIHVMDFHDIAQYEPDADEPERTGQEAWEVYQTAGQPASSDLGHYQTAELIVQGVFIGDERRWDEIQLVRMSSRAGFQALLDDPTREASRYHRLAALENNYSMITFPTLSVIPYSGGVTPGLEVTPDGTGTVCQTDDDCPGDGVDTCLSDGGGGGYCTREGCGTGDCQAPFVCCRACATTVVEMLPFDGSACLPSESVAQLAAPPLSCTCD